MSTSTDGTFTMATLLHMIPIKLSSSNYLLWRNQMLPLFSYQKLSSHIDGTSAAPRETIEVENKPVSNPAFSAWTDLDQRAVILLNSSLTEEAAAEVLGLSTSHSIWTALEKVYSNSSVERIHSLRDSLRHMTKAMNKKRTMKMRGFTCQSLSVMHNWCSVFLDFIQLLRGDLGGTNMPKEEAQRWNKENPLDQFTHEMEVLFA